MTSKLAIIPKYDYFSNPVRSYPLSTLKYTVTISKLKNCVDK